LKVEDQGLVFPPGASASASRAVALPGLSGFCWDECGAQPDSHTIRNVAGTRPSGSAYLSA
jgi:hypothetical protein